MITPKLTSLTLYFLILISSFSVSAQCDFSSTGVGSFDGTNYTNWSTFTSAGSGDLATFSQESSSNFVHSGSESMKIDVSTSHNWGVRMFNSCDLPLTKDRLYTIQFWIYGGNSKQLKVALQHLNGGTVVISEQVVNLTSNTWKMYEVSITSDGTYSKGKIKFTFPNTGVYYLDDVIVTELLPDVPKVIDPTDQGIHYTGVAHNDITSSSATFYRFPYNYATNDESNQNPFVQVKTAKRAIASSGISIEFKTKSKNIKAKFKEITTTTGGVTTLSFAVYKNGTLHNVYTNNNDNVELTFNDATGTNNTWRITMPSFAQIQFLGLEIDQTSTLETLPTDNRPVYVAIGNSITHGVGQTKYSTHLTYPWLVADSLNFHLYNWGVGGSKVHESVFNNFSEAGITPDVVSVLWGYNDFNCAHVNCNSDNYIINNTMKYYETLMTNLASTFPNATIVGILPTYSNTPAKSSVRSLDYLRTTQQTLITELQKTYNNVHFFNGNGVTDSQSLNDDVHLNDLGAVQVANGLIKELIDQQVVNYEVIDTLILRSEYEAIGDEIIDLNHTYEGTQSYHLSASSNHYTIDPITGIISISTEIADVKNSVQLDVLTVTNGLTTYNISVVDAYDYFIAQHPEYTVLEDHQEIIAKDGSPYTPYNNIWGKGSAVNGVDFRMSMLVQPDKIDSTVYIWDTPSKANAFGGSSVWSYQNLFWGERYNLRENIGGFPIKINNISHLTMNFNYEQLFGTETYKVALNHFLNEEDYLAPFTENDGDFFIVFNQLGNYVPPYQDHLTDTLIGGKEYVLLHDSTGTIQTNIPEGYQLRRAIIKNGQQFTNGALDLLALYKSFSSRGFLDEELYFSHIQFGIEITEGWGAVRMNQFNMDYQPKLITNTYKNQENNIKIFPNPSTEKIFITGIDNGEDYQLKNILGESVKSSQYNNNGIYVNGLSKGIYFLIIEGTSHKVLIK